GAGRLAAMAPPTIAPPSSPAAMPTPTPSCAFAGVTLDAPAIIATASSAAKVFFMLGQLLEMALLAPGLAGGALSAHVGTVRSRERQNGQPQVNGRSRVIRKSGLFQVTG